jgi:CO/xanthine dehydrogenase Mo-binding subunit
VARLIKTEKEVEGRYTEQWVVVEGDDDALDQWPQGPRDVVGQPAPRQDGHQRARGQAEYTADLQLPGMLHAAVLRSPLAHARVKKLDLSRALELPGVLGAIGPDDCHVLQTEAGFHGAPIAAVAADSYSRAREALSLVDLELEELEPLLDPEEAVRQGSVHEEARRYERGDVDAGVGEHNIVVAA